MSTRLIKVCLRPGCDKRYSENSVNYAIDLCKCVAPLKLEIEKITKVYNVFGNPEGCETQNEQQLEQIKEKDDIFVIDNSGVIHFNLKKKEELLDKDRVVVYVDKRIYKEIPLKYDETTFGRLSTKFKPDVDLSEIDMNRKTSRKHLMIYKYGDKYIARNMTDKTVHVEKTLLKEGEDCELKDGNLIVLSRSVVMVFRKGNLDVEKKSI